MNVAKIPAARIRRCKSLQFILRLHEGCATGTYAEGPPPLRPHALWRDFPHGVSAGGKSLVTYGPLVLPGAGLNIWFRRFLMRQYMRRFR